MQKLTAKQEQFAQKLANGASQSDAYKAVYNAQKMAASTIWEQASKLAKNNKVAARVAELRQGLVDVTAWTRAKSTEALERLLGLAEDTQNVSGGVSAIKELNLIHGHHAPQKHELTGKNGAPISTSNQKIDFAKLSDAAIAELVGATGGS